MSDPGSTVHAIYALGPLAIAGIGLAASKLLGPKQPKETPAFTALDEIRRRRLAELDAIRNFQQSFSSQPASTNQPGMGAGSAPENAWLAILRRMRGF